MAVALTCVDSAHAESDIDEARLTYCGFGPKLKAFRPKVGADGCSGGAQVQGHQWACTKFSEVETRTSEFRINLEKEAKIECEQKCASRKKGCHAVWVTPFRQCGLSVTVSDSLETGRRLGCSSTCGGQAFVYCSIYNSGFILNESELMAF